MHRRRFWLAGVVTLTLAACSSSSTPAGAPAATASATQAAGAPATAAPDSTGAPAATPNSPAGGGSGLGAVDTSGLATLPTEKICTLLTTSEAAALLGTAIDGTPNGTTMAGLGTNCIWSAAMDATGSAPSFKVEFNTLSWSAQVSIFKATNTVQQFTIAGRPAVGVDPKDPANAFVKSQLAVSLSDDPKAVCLYVEAPTMEIARQVAEKVLPRIAGLK